MSSTPAVVAMSPAQSVLLQPGPSESALASPQDKNFDIHMSGETRAVSAPGMLRVDHIFKASKKAVGSRAGTRRKKRHSAIAKMRTQPEQTSAIVEGIKRMIQEAEEKKAMQEKEAEGLEEVETKMSAVLSSFQILSQKTDTHSI
jgi:hypothetical protein